MPFPRASALSETQTDSFRIWNWVADSISFDDNRYVKHASKEKRAVKNLNLQNEKEIELNNIYQIELGIIETIIRLLLLESSILFGSSILLVLWPSLVN